MRHLKVEIPRSQCHPLTRLKVRHPQGECVVEVDATSVRHVEIHIPDGVAEEEVQIDGEYCDARGQRDEGMGVVSIKTADKAEMPQEAVKRGGRKSAPKADDPSASVTSDAQSADKPGDAAKS